MLKSYDKSLDCSYSIGVYPTLELMENQPSRVREIIIDEKGRSNSGLKKILTLCETHSVKVNISPNTVKHLSNSGNAYCLGIFDKYENPLEAGKNHLVLVNPSDMGNLGTVIRTALAFDVADLAIIRPAVDVFDPKVIRSSMGALFKIRFEYFESFPAYREKFNNNIYTLRTDASTSIDDLTFNTPMSLVLGNEGSGLPPDLDQAGERIRIPQSENVDSLNLGVAAGIALHRLYSFGLTLNRRQ